MLKRFLLLIFSFVMLGTTLAEPPKERVVLVVGNTEEAEKQASEFAKRLLPLGAFQVIEWNSKDGQAFSGSPQSNYLIRQVGRKIVWQRPLLVPDKVLQDFQSSRYDLADGKLIAWSQTVPASADSPLRRDELIEFYVGGRPDLQVEAQVGAKRIKLYEDRPGYYAGAYRIESEDRVNTDIIFRAQDSIGLTDSAEMGRFTLIGLKQARLTNLEQISLRNWAFQGEASPGNAVEISIDIRIGSLFGKQTIRKKVETVADESGHFEAVIQLGTLTGSPKGTVTLKTLDLDGVEVVSPSQDVHFRSRVIYYHDPWRY